MNIFVGNLARNASEEDLKLEFEKFGQVSVVKIIRDMFSRESKGFGFVEMPDKLEAEAAIKGLDTVQFMGKPLQVNEARPREDRRGGGGSRAGGKRRFR